MSDENRESTDTTVTPSRRGPDQAEHGDKGVTVSVTDDETAEPNRHGEEPERNRHGRDTRPSRSDPLRDKGGDGCVGRDGSPATSASSPEQLLIDRLGATVVDDAGVR